MSNDATVAFIDAADARAMIDGGAVVLDVREPAEVLASGRVPGSINIPLAEFPERTDPASPLRDPALSPETPVILYCASGKRSQFAGEKLSRSAIGRSLTLAGSGSGCSPVCR